MLIFSAPDDTSSVEISIGVFPVIGGAIEVPDDTPFGDLVGLAANRFIFTGSTNMPQRVNVKTGQFHETGYSDSLYAIGDINVSIWPIDGSQPVTGSALLDRSFNGGTTWLAVTESDEPVRFSTFPLSTTRTESEAGVLYRIDGRGLTGGAAMYRISF